MKRFLLVLLIAAASFGRLAADEGMWLLPYLEKLNIKDMKKEGFKLSAKDIYNINQNSLKDAIVIFDRGCTGEIVSSEGLLFTNHHCGYGAIQQLSSVDHDYLKNGFWAMNRTEELPAEGVTVTFIRRIEDVTSQILPLLNNGMNTQERSQVAEKFAAEQMQKFSAKNPTQSVSVKPFFGGNQYFMFVMERYDDIRLVGAPPSSIGKFGGDTDNWMWPRHTGDFSVFRVYSDKDGRPAKYSKDNVPYNAPSHLDISLKGYKEGDFAMIMGFPGSTQRYMTSWEIDRTLNQDNPIRIFIRGERQEILKKDMAASDKVRIQYASKYAQSSNYWKNSIGMSRGLRKLNVKAKKVAIEDAFRSWLEANPTMMEKYGEALPLIENGVRESLKPRALQQYYSEALMRGVELVMLSSAGYAIQSADGARFKTIVSKMKATAADSYKDYNAPTDRKVAKRMIAIVRDSLAKDDLPSFFTTIDSEFGGDIDKYVDHLFDNSIFADEAKLKAWLEAPDQETVKKDPGTELAVSVITKFNSLAPVLAGPNEEFARGHRLFIAGLMEMQPDRKFYPDANFTIRLTYGQILPYSPADAVEYNYYTTLSGVMAKEDPANPVEFTVPAKLKELYENKDFGRYAYKGDVPVGFLSNNDITGGNSGSPVMNGKGQLIGLAFDGNWEAMSGDIAFEPALQRTISVDVRYVLFIIDKFAGAGYLLDEMTIVK